MDKWFHFDKNSSCAGDGEGGEFVLKADDGTFWKAAYPIMRETMQVAAKRAAESRSIASDRAAAYRISVTHDEARCSGTIFVLIFIVIRSIHSFFRRLPFVDRSETPWRWMRAAARWFCCPGSS